MWEKKGLIFNVNGEFDWNKSHAQVPVVDVLTDSLRIYYATRNAAGQSNISYFEVDKMNPEKVLYIHNTTLLDFGKFGAFDDCGVMPTSIININNRKFLYYIGWTTRGTVPYQNAIGLAISEDGGKTFQKYSEGPIITINHREPYFSGTAYVMQDSGVFKMWYLSCVKWIKKDDAIEPLYNIKYAESLNAIDWLQTGKVAIDLAENEGGLASASVLKIGNRYHMWYGVRGIFDYRKFKDQSYKIGYAISNDGNDWIRKDKEVGITISENSWDSEMISYPCVIQNGNDLIMFYNGNGFGRSGIGYAVISSSKIVDI